MFRALGLHSVDASSSQSKNIIGSRKKMYVRNIESIDRFFVVSQWWPGLCGVPGREALLAALLLPEAQPQEEDHGLFQLVHVGQVPPRATQLHRPARHVHPR